MKNLLKISAIISTILLVGCGSSAPSDDELLSKFYSAHSEYSNKVIIKDATVKSCEISGESKVFDYEKYECVIEAKSYYRNGRPIPDLNSYTVEFNWNDKKSDYFSFWIKTDFPS
ncbi:hypothetical protein VCRA2123E130_430013 [Vibrio crassostreae]|nr:hypothetical protein VCRA2123E130_430013 [Vibrio crassostreae]